MLSYVNMTHHMTYDMLGCVTSYLHLHVSHGSHEKIKSFKMIIVN